MNPTVEEARRAASRTPGWEALSACGVALAALSACVVALAALSACVVALAALDGWSGIAVAVAVPVVCAGFWISVGGPRPP